MKLFKSVIIYFISLITFFIFLFILSKGLLTNTFDYYRKYSLFFNILFATVYFYFNKVINFKVCLILSIISLFFTFIISEVIYPNILKNNIVLNNDEKMIKEELVNNEINVEDIEVIPINNIEKAQYYLNKKEYSSAWIYADIALETENNILLVSEIKEKAEINLKSNMVNDNNPKYIESLKYKKFINQNRFLDAYYFCKDNISELLYDHDFLIKMKNSYQELLKNYYSIDKVESILKLPGYSDIKFYYFNKTHIIYKIEKIVEYNNEFYLKNTQIGNKFYKYLYINKNGKIFSSGFKEDERFIIENITPNIPIKGKDLKIYSKEFYKLISSSLYFNIKIFKMKNVSYIQEYILSDLIISKLTSYLIIFIVFFMVYLFINNMDYLNYLFCYSLFLFSIKWFIKKVGLILISYELNLSFIVVFLLYSFWLIIIILRTKLVLSLSLPQDS